MGFGGYNGGKRFLIREKFVKQRWIKTDDACDVFREEGNFDFS